MDVSTINAVVGVVGGALGIKLLDLITGWWRGRIDDRHREARERDQARRQAWAVEEEVHRLRVLLRAHDIDPGPREAAPTPVQED